MITGIVVVLFIAIIAIDLLPHWKSTDKKEKFLYCTLLLLSFGVLTLFTFNVPIPSPAKLITQWIDALLPMIKQR